MGAATSVNSAEIITQAVNDILTEVVQEAVTSNDQSIIISVRDTQGDVEISGVDATQQINVKSNVLLSQLSSVENDAKINQQIEQLAKSLISGLNLAQVSVSTSTLNSIVDSCIRIKNNSFSACKNFSSQNFLLTVRKTQGNVKIDKLSINQLSNGILSCIMNASNNSILKSDTDLKISQISSATAEGLDIKWVAIAAAIGFGGVSLGGASLIKNILGPGMMIGGAVCVYYGFTQKTSETKTTLLYLKDTLENTVGGLRKIKSEPLTQNDNAISHGEANIYETYGSTITLYNGGNTSEIINLKNNVTISDIDFKYTRATQNPTLCMIEVKDSTTKYPRTTFEVRGSVKGFQFKSKITEREQGELPDDFILIDDTNFNYVHRLKFFHNDRMVYEYVLEPTIIVYHPIEKDTSFQNLIKNPLFLIGISLISVGLLTILLNAFRGGK